MFKQVMLFVVKVAVYLLVLISDFLGQIVGRATGLG